MEAMIVQQLVLSSESSSSDDDMEARGPMELKPRVEEFIERVVDQYSDEVFRENFRLARNTFNESITHGSGASHNISQSTTTDHIMVSSDTRLIPGWPQVCELFGVLVNAIFSLSPTVINWPTPVEVEHIVEQFHLKGFPSTIGAIDGTHIPIPQPKDHGISYINRHNYSSIIQQITSPQNFNENMSPLGNVLLQGSEESFPNDVHMIRDKA
ncbi:hypothetical protein NQ315_011279 [Exocentrus adspersus]|uniref:DDE Tnp4 domain-containing protein n=1 Tax=Exocentrus adspersus TaxID=1586481 RepID=A0AAV8VJE0_9CUCU|nr:hypothetical protein NQ315_011279 [Exocentrus adspersus]